MAQLAFSTPAATNHFERGSGQLSIPIVYKRKKMADLEGSVDGTTSVDVLRSGIILCKGVYVAKYTLYLCSLADSTALGPTGIVLILVC